MAIGGNLTVHKLGILRVTECMRKRTVKCSAVQKEYYEMISIDVCNFQDTSLNKGRGKRINVEYQVGINILREFLLWIIYQSSPR